MADEENHEEYDKIHIIMLYLSKESEYQVVKDLHMLFKSNKLTAWKG